MEINAREISDLDPGAIPGGSTNLFPRVIAGREDARFLRGRLVSTGV